MRTRTRLQIRDGARARADMVGNDNVSDTQANYQIDQALARLWGILTRASPTRYLSSSTISATAGTLEYAVPSDFMAVYAVDLEVSSTERYPVDPFNFNERSFGQLTAYPGFGPVTTRYQILYQGLAGTAARLVFDVDPGTRTYRLWYIQNPQLLTSDASTFDGVAGWEDWIELTVAIFMLTKTERPSDDLKIERQKVEAEILAGAPIRDSGRASTIQDTAGRLRMVRRR